ncbi:MAG: segregation/condensation protein A [Zoogloea sp.]|uniref:segregation and condensation protein A n=1 Tax=Zoogloea sp. TaxID=49181 RepID=UPI002611CF4A|nr:segregation/condensation protein A [Zoogloea sp.]MDD3328073.1 segregation/condensation protein A [Zoogloea sp.]
MYGEPIFDLPKDLYIPPDALEVILEAFEGPLDLLLYLIRKANINVLDIPMVPLTAQYLEYVEAMRHHNLELAADYLLMAATLLEIKSRMLLPRPPRADEAEELDPRAELVRRLLEYEQIKRAAARLDQLPRVERDFEWVGVFVAEKVVERQPTVTLHDLQLAWLKIARQSRLKRNHTIQREELSVREHMTIILRKLSDDAFVVFETLFDHTLGPAGLVVSFLATLELVKERLVVVTQNEAFAPIYVKRADAAAGFD